MTSKDQDISGSSYLSNLLNDLEIMKIRFKLEPNEIVRLPAYLGSTIRGGLAWALRKIACAFRNQECRNCMLRNRCAYSYLFETPFLSTNSIKTGLDTAPHPIVIEPPLANDPPWQPGNPMSFKILLIGQACDYFPYLVAAVQKMGTHGLGVARNKFKLIAVDGMDNHRLWQELWSAADNAVLDTPPTIRMGSAVLQDKPGQKVSLSFLTPARLMQKGNLLRQLEFRSLARNLLFRSSTLLNMKKEQQKFVDFRAILDRTLTVQTTESNLSIKHIPRYSNRQKAKLSLDGLIGNITFSGDGVREFWPYLMAGEVIHVGKSTVFGLGQYRIE